MSSRTKGAAPRKSVAHRLVLALVAVTIVSSGFVFSEPAPVDALTIGLIVLLPVVGLVSFNPTLIAYFSLWTVAGACAVLAAALSLDLGITLPHVAVTLYLTLASVVFAGFIAKSPTRAQRADLQGLDLGRRRRRRLRPRRLFRPPARRLRALHQVRPRQRPLQGPQRLRTVPGPAADLHGARRPRPALAPHAGAARHCRLADADRASDLLARRLDEPRRRARDLRLPHHADEPPDDHARQAHGAARCRAAVHRGPHHDRALDRLHLRPPRATLDAGDGVRQRHRGALRRPAEGDRAHHREPARARRARVRRALPPRRGAQRLFEHAAQRRLARRRHLLDPRRA